MEGSTLQIPPEGELARKLIHLAALTLPVGFYFAGRDLGLPLLVIASVGVVVSDALRLRWPCAGNVYRRFFGTFTRTREETGLTGASFMMVGQTLAAALFPMPEAVVAMTFGVVGDSAAAIVGRYFGRSSFREGKSVEGSVACLLASLVGGWVWQVLPLGCVAIGALLATAAEAFPSRVNDNITMPVVSGAVMAAWMLLWG